VNMRRGRFLPWPMETYLSAPEETWALRVLIEQPSLAAAWAAVLSPSGGGWRGGATCRCLRTLSKASIAPCAWIALSKSSPRLYEMKTPGRAFGFMLGKGWIMSRRSYGVHRSSPGRGSTAAAGALYLSVNYRHFARLVGAASKKGGRRSSLRRTVAAAR